MPKEDSDVDAIDQKSIPNDLVDELIKIAEERGTGWDNVVRASDMSKAIDAAFEKQPDSPEGLKDLTNELSAYIAYLDDKGTLKENQETIKDLANLTASPEEYAKMLKYVGENFGGYSDETVSSMAYYLNNGSLSKEEISTFIAALSSNISQSTLEQLEGATLRIEDPATKALVEYNYAYFRNHPSELNAAGTELTAPDLINYTDVDTFNKAFENDPEGKKAFLKYLIENEPEKAEILASNLGHNELVALNKLLLSETSLGYLNYAETYRELTTQELATLLTGSQFPAPAPELASPVVEATQPATEQSTAANVPHSEQQDIKEEITSENKASSEEPVIPDDQRLTKEDLIAMQNDYPVIREFIKDNDKEIPENGYTIDEFEAAISAYANGEGRDDLGLSEGTNYTFDASLSTDGNHITNVSLTKGMETTIDQAAAAAGVEDVAVDTTPTHNTTAFQRIDKNSAISI